MSVELPDLYAEGVSHCCSAKIFVPDICSRCGEHCEPVFMEDEGYASV